MEGRTVLITGGNAGIGRATAEALAARGAEVVITSRDAGRGEAAAAAIGRAAGRPVSVMELDLASFASIRAFAGRFLERYPALHVLVNNAGLLLSDRRTTAEGFEQTFGVNHLGHFLLTKLLLDRLKGSSGARIVNVSSDAHRSARSGLEFDDLQSERSYKGFPVYARSKLANVLFTRELARRLDGCGVTTNALHPGVVATRFAADGDARGPVAWFFRFARPFLRTPMDGAATSIHCATAPELEGVTGRYFANRAERAPSRAALDDDAARRLWDASEELVARHGGA
jgi:NAD(P)-dependent dehydrogenase (short-subunit alcohol dehydrogenase family)